MPFTKEMAIPDPERRKKVRRKIRMPSMPPRETPEVCRAWRRQWGRDQLNGCSMTKLDAGPNLWAYIADSLKRRHAASVELVCQMYGISLDTLKDWKKKAKSGLPENQIFVAFFEEMRAIQAAKGINILEELLDLTASSASRAPALKYVLGVICPEVTRDPDAPEPPAEGKGLNLTFIQNNDRRSYFASVTGLKALVQDSLNSGEINEDVIDGLVVEGLRAAQAEQHKDDDDERD